MLAVPDHRMFATALPPGDANISGIDAITPPGDAVAVTFNNFTYDPHNLAFDTNFMYLSVYNGTFTIRKIRKGNLKVEGSISLGTPTVGGNADFIRQMVEYDGYLYVVGYYGTLYKIDTSDMSIATTAGYFCTTDEDLTSSPFPNSMSLCVGEVSGTLYVYITTFYGRLVRLNAATGALVNGGDFNTDHIGNLAYYCTLCHFTTSSVSGNPVIYLIGQLNNGGYTTVLEVHAGTGVILRSNTGGNSLYVDSACAFGNSSIVFGAHSGSWYSILTKIDLTNLSFTAGTQLVTKDYKYSALNTDGTYVYASTYDMINKNVAILYRHSLSSLALSSYLDFGVSVVARMYCNTALDTYDNIVWLLAYDYPYVNRNATLYGYKT